MAYAQIISGLNEEQELERRKAAAEARRRKAAEALQKEADAAHLEAYKRTAGGEAWILPPKEIRALVNAYKRNKAEGADKLLATLRHKVGGKILLFPDRDKFPFYEDGEKIYHALPRDEWMNEADGLDSIHGIAYNRLLEASDGAFSKPFERKQNGNGAVHYGDKMPPRHGKTARDRASGATAQHAKNKAAKAKANRDRAHGGSGPNKDKQKGGKKGKGKK